MRRWRPELRRVHGTHLVKVRVVIFLFHFILIEFYCLRFRFVLRGRLPNFRDLLRLTIRFFFVYPCRRMLEIKCRVTSKVASAALELSYHELIWSPLPVQLVQDVWVTVCRRDDIFIVLIGKEVMAHAEIKFWRHQFVTCTSTTTVVIWCAPSHVE